MSRLRFYTRPSGSLLNPAATSMSTVIVFGASGLLGSSLVPTLRACGHIVMTQGRGNQANLCIDPSNHMAVAMALAKYRPTAIVNLVAVTNVDQCEEQPELAWQVNAGVVGAIANGIAALSADTDSRPHLVHLSTDQLYNGPGPHAEDVVSPINVYGLTKYTGELLAERIGATVLRSNFYGRSHCAGRVSFSDWLVQSMRAGSPITVFDDVRFSAVHIDTLCAIIARSIERRPSGVFNVGCRDSLSKASFALSLASVLKVSTDQVKVGTSATADFKARRPLDMSLQVSLIEKLLNIQCPNMLDEIEYTAKEYLND